MVIFSNNKKRVRFYLVVGLVFCLIWIFNEWVSNPATIFERAVNNLWRVIYVVALHLILFEYALPFIGRKRKTFLYNVAIALPIVFVFLMLYSWGLYGWRLIGIGLSIYTPLNTVSIEEGVTSQMAYSMGSLVFFFVIRHIYSYIKIKNAAQQLQIEKKIAELNYLKSQTNPHFLFNTLNNIYSLARDKSDLAPESILRLSKILRYILYETDTEFIAVEQELKIISSYIDLEKLRYDESLLINFNHDVEDMNQALPPLLLMPLVENAFKHGVSETRSRPFVDIHLSIKDRKLNFSVKNSTEPVIEEISVKENIGLGNLRRQLELLYKDFSLVVQQGSSEFSSNLKIDLGSHIKN